MADFVFQHRDYSHSISDQHIVWEIYNRFLFIDMVVEEVFFLT